MDELWIKISLMLSNDLSGEECICGVTGPVATKSVCVCVWLLGKVAQLIICDSTIADGADALSNLFHPCHSFSFFFNMVIHKRFHIMERIVKNDTSLQHKGFRPVNGFPPSSYIF